MTLPWLKHKERITDNIIFCSLRPPNQIMWFYNSLPFMWWMQHNMTISWTYWMTYFCSTNISSDTFFHLNPASRFIYRYMNYKFIQPDIGKHSSLNGSWDLIRAEHECTCGWPGSVPTGISNSKCYTWIRAGFSHRVTRSRKSKTHRFSSTHGSTGIWEYLQVLMVLNINNVD